MQGLGLVYRAQRMHVSVIRGFKGGSFEVEVGLCFFGLCLKVEAARFQASWQALNPWVQRSSPSLPNLEQQAHLNALKP